MRANPEAVGAVLLTGRRGERVPLARVAHITRDQAPEAINHENGERRLVVQTNVRGRDVGSFVSEAQARVAAQLTLPPGYCIDWGGQFENQQRATARLALVVPLSIAIIFLLLFVTFGTVRQAALVLLQRAVRARRRRRGAVAARPHPEPVGVGRLHRALRRGGAERHRAGERRQPPARAGRAAARGGAGRRRRRGCGRC